MTSGVFPLSSGSEGSVDKDTLIDEMQEKIGELLKCNQDLCEANNQIEALKEQLTQNEKQFRIEKIALEDEIGALKATNQENEDELKDLRERSKKAEAENDALNEQLWKMKEAVKDAYNASDDEVIGPNTTVQAIDLQSVLEDKERKIADLTAQVQELKEANTRNMDSLVSYTKECETLNSEIEKVRGEKAALEGDLEDAKAHTLEIQESLEQEKENRKALEVELEQSKEEKSEIQKEKTKLQSEIDGKNDLIKDLQGKIAVIKALDVEAESFEEIAEFLAKKIKQAASYKSKFAKLKKYYGRLVSEMELRDKQIEEAAHDLSDVQVNASNLQKKAEETENERQRLQERVNNLELRVQIGRVVANSNQTVMKNFLELQALIEPDFEPPSFRSIIMASLMIRRWRKLIGSEKVYEQDSRSWWWLEPNKSPENSVRSKINRLMARLHHLEEESKTFNDKLEALEEQKKLKEQEVEEQARQLESYQSKVQKMEGQIAELSEYAESMVDTEDYETLAAKYKQIKSVMKEVKLVIRDQEAQINTLTEKIQILEQEKKMQHSRLKLSAKASKNVQNQLLQAQDEVDVLKMELNSKSREVLSLERGIAKAQNEKNVACAQARAVAGECLLGKCDGTPDYQRAAPTDLSARLRQMSRLLSAE